MSTSFKGSKQKARSTIPKEFIEKGIRPAIENVRGVAADPLGQISDIQQGLGITPGVTFDPQGQLGAAATRDALPDISALFGAGAGQQGQTIAGGNLDVTKNAAFQNLERALQATGQNTFQGLLDQARQSAARGGVFRSSAAQGLEANAAQQVADQLQQTLAQFGTQQFSQERAAQEAAAQRGVSGLPDLANQLFGQGTALTNVQLQDLASRLQAASGAQGLGLTPQQLLAAIASGTAGQLGPQQNLAGQIVGGIGQALQPSSIFKSE